ncbi:AAEL002117-PA [Aedes aegypti]|nr:AAEL002117-PA [Aedes aegypti]
MTYDLNPEYVKGTINVKVENGVYSIGMNCDLLKKIDGNFWVTPVFSKKLGKSYVPIIDLKLDTCKTDPTLAENPLIRFVSTEAKKFVSFGLMCPYEPGHYVVNDFTFEKSNALMNFIPKGNYHVSLTSRHQPPGSKELNKVMSLSFYADFE